MIKSFLFIGILLICLHPSQKEYDAELVNQRTTADVSNGKLASNFYYEIKINNRAGEKYTKVRIPYSKLVRVSNIEAIIKDSNGRVVKKLTKSDIIDKSSISDFSLYEDDFIKEFTLKHNSYPYYLIYSFQLLENEFMSISNWTPVIGKSVPTDSALLEVSVPVDYPITYKNTNVAAPEIDTIKDKVVYKWKTSYTNVIESEEMSPSLSMFYPSVHVVPTIFKFELKGSFDSWKSFGNWQYSLLQGLNDLPDNEKARIAQLIKGVEDDKEKIRILYHYLQDETRYINVTVETGGWKPYPASYVSQNKYGDCKALSNYFRSILDYVNIPSYYSIVNAGDQIREVDTAFPSARFNHIILYIPLKSEDVWLDCTSDAAFNYLGAFTQNRNAFIISRDESRFIKTPQLKPSDVLETRNIEISYNTPEATARFQNRYKGDSYDVLLYLQ